MTTRASRIAVKGPVFLNSRSRVLFETFGCLAVCFLAASTFALAQDASDDAQAIVVAEHWSPYQAPTSYPEGTELHIIVDGDTLWAISGQYLENPYLWPQLWDANRYIDDPHLIYPGDPVMLPDVDMVRPGDVAGEPGAAAGPGGTAGGPGGTGAAGAGGAAGPGAGPGGGQAGAGGPLGPTFYPAYEEQTIACAGFYAENEDDTFRIIGTEEGDSKVGYAVGDIMYLSRGTNQGVLAGDRFYVQRLIDFSWGMDGRHVQRTGAVVVLAAQADSSMAEIVASCTEMQVGDYLTPFSPIPVPLLPRQAAATRLTPETGEMRGEIVASLEEITTLGEGYLVSINVGENDGVVPGNLFTVFRYVHPDAPRKVLGELAVLTVQQEHATAKIMESYDFMVVGDLIELK